MTHCSGPIAFVHMNHLINLVDTNCTFENDFKVAVYSNLQCFRFSVVFNPAHVCTHRSLLPCLYS